MKKSFLEKKPTDNLSKTVTDNETSNDFKEELHNESKNKVKKRVGRPKTKTEETRTINIAVPISVLEKMDVAKVCYGNNLTGYINKLIEKDIAANYNKYETINNSLNDFK